MRSLSKIGSVAVFLVLAACSGASEVAETGDVPAASQGDRVGAINALVASAGFLLTDKTADAQPVEKSPPKKEPLVGEGGAQFECTYQDYSLTKVPEKFVALNPNADVLWPGSLVQGKSMAGGILDPIPVKRAPGTITLTLASGGGGPFFKKMDAASLSAAVQAQNEILDAYTGATPAKFSYSFESIYSSEQLSVAVDANVEGTNWSASAALSVDKTDERNRFLIQFSQEYFTMAFDPPQGAAGVFDPSVTADDLRPYAAAGNPPVYVASVTYGRIFYILFESKASALEIAAAVKGSYSGPSISASGSVNASWKKTINEATVKAFGLGGNAEMAINAVTGQDQFEKIQKFLTTGANFDKQNPGVPISYTIRHLTDATQVKLALTTEYTAKQCRPMTVGCDGVKGSGKAVDQCGVCGGDGTTCDSCKASATLPYGAPNGAYVNFTAPSTEQAHGTVIRFPDGNYYGYGKRNGDVLPICHRVTWGNVALRCHDGAWVWNGGQSFSNDSWCTVNSNSDWSSNGASISAGWQP